MKNHLKIILEQLKDHFKTNNYYYIADNLKKDFITPNKLGWQTVGLIDNGLNIHVYSENYDLLAYRPQHFIFQLSELITL